MRCPDCGEKFLVHAIVDKADSLYKGFCVQCDKELYLQIRIYMSPKSRSFDNIIITFLELIDEK